jgi:AraC-like DNA-binding protein
MQTFPVRGRGEAVVNEFASPLDPGHGVTVSPGMNFAVDLAASYETLLLLIKPQILAAKLAAIIGRPICGPLNFHPAQDYTRPAAKALRDHFLLLVEMVTTAAAPISRVLLGEFEQTLLVMFLHANRHNYDRLLARPTADPGLGQVRRAEEYLEANAQRPITLEGVVEAIGVGALDLCRSFRNSRGCSPMQFVRRVRLGHAHESLQYPDAATTVAAVAADSGYADLARFDQDYVQAFGERPAQTLGRSKGVPAAG